MAFVRTPYITRLEFVDGDLGFCRPCDGQVPLRAEDGGYVACEKGHRQHAANLLVNGSHRPAGTA